MHLITGATGNVGRHIVEGLLAAGAGVRASSRNPATAELPAGVDIVASQTDSPAFAGVVGAFLNPAAVHDTADRLLAQASAAGVRRIVLLSSSSVLDDHPDNHTGIAHRDLEQRIERSGLEWTFLRAGMFAANTRQWAARIRADHIIHAAYTSAAIAPIHERDLAAAAVRALLTDDLLHQSPVLTGPELITQADQAKLIGDIIGKPVRLEETDARTAREHMIAQRMPPEIADSLLRYYERAITQPIEPTPISTDLTRQQPRTYRQWVLEHAADFR
ncbi:NAD(P)H-binding protein [Nocardia sp. NPDC046763]|uniref:SDR family oxidoreductase n=1 Tax=Nocardia sp. NPDC046763 TaxID=3155256 RepID=UPI0033FC6A2F